MVRGDQLSARHALLLKEGHVFAVSSAMRICSVYRRAQSRRPSSVDKIRHDRGGSRRPSTYLVVILAALGGAGITFGATSPASATTNTLYVSSTGSDAGSCTSISSPCATISYALGVASSGDTIYVSGTIADIVSVDASLTIAQWPGGSPAVVDGTGNNVVITIGSAVDVTIDQLTVTGGSGVNNGGGIDNAGNLTVDDSVISGNTANGDFGDGGEGGGIDNTGTLSVDDTTISDNSVSGIGDAGGGAGGGISNYDGTASIDDSTISGNSANSGVSYQGGYGGGIFSEGGALSIGNSTISGNSAQNEGYGGGIFSTSEELSIDDSTISGNSVGTAGQGAGLFTVGFGSATLAGNILASSGGAPQGGECYVGNDATITDDGYNVDDDGTCDLSAVGSVSDSSAIDNYLGPLQSNGGPTDTIALLPGNSGTPNPAQAVIPAGFTASGQTEAACSQPDQQGLKRADPCDMGAFALTLSLYALPDGTASEPCTTEGTTPSSVCSLDTAITEANTESDFSVDLESPTGDGDYTGVSDAGVSETITAPLTIQADPDPGFDTATPTLDGEDQAIVLNIAGNDNVTVSGVVIQNGEAPFGSHGGAIFNGGTGTLTVSGSTFIDNRAGGGGAINNSNGGTLDVSDSTFTGNYSDGGGAIDNATDDAGTGTLVVTDSTFSDNTDGNYSGGAILNGYGTGNDGTATISNSTFSGNTTPFDDGGAIDNGDNGGTGTLTLINSTFVGNTIGAIQNGSGGTVTASANIFADSCGQEGTWTDGGYNVGSDSSCFNDGTGDDDSAGSGLPALLAPLADNGGPTETSELLAGNPAIAIVPYPTSALCAIVADQRGAPSRPASACDAGAVQFAGQTIGSVSAPPMHAVVGGPGYTPSATATSGLAVSMTVDQSTTAVCSISAGAVSFNTVGSCRLDFNQAGDTDWAPATGLVQTFTVSPDSPEPISHHTSGYRLVASDGGVFSYGDAPFLGSHGGSSLNKPIVGIAATPNGKGYWLVASDGGVFSYGDAPFLGSHGGSSLNKPIVGIAATPNGKGYWLVASDGGVFSYGDAPFLGSHGGSSLNKPIVGIAATPNGKGYWLVASDGGVFSYGDAPFLGSHGGSSLNKPIVGIAATPNGKGYWLVASDGGVFSYGDAPYLGSMGGSWLADPVVGIAATPNGKGYWLVASDGGVFSYGDAPYLGSMGGSWLTDPVVGIG